MACFFNEPEVSAAGVVEARVQRRHGGAEVRVMQEICLFSLCSSARHAEPYCFVSRDEAAPEFAQHALFTI